MMGPRQVEQGALFYNFSLDRHVPADHLLRSVDRFIDLAGLRRELAPFYSETGGPSVDPELMIRMLVVGYVFAIRSERLICREVQVNLAYLGFASSVLRTPSRIIRRSHAPVTSASARERFSVACSSGLSRRVLLPG